MNFYWLNETPVTVKTPKNTLNYYRNAGRLQISAADWKTPDGGLARGKTVTLQLDALNDEGKELFRTIAAAL